MFFCFPSAQKFDSDCSEGNFCDDSDDGIFDEEVFSPNLSNPEQTIEFKDSNMASTVSVPKAAPASNSTTPKKFFPTEAPTHVDAAEKVYDTAKGVWAWGKGIVVFKPFLGIAEHVASRVVGVTGNNLSTLDGGITEKLHSVDDKILNPAIAAIVGALLGAAGKTEDTVKPIIIALLKPLGLIKDEAENPELTTVKGVNVH